MNRLNRRMKCIALIVCILLSGIGMHVDSVDLHIKQANTSCAKLSTAGVRKDCVDYGINCEHAILTDGMLANSNFWNMDVSEVRILSYRIISFMNSIVLCSGQNRILLYLLFWDFLAKIFVLLLFAIVFFSLNVQSRNSHAMILRYIHKKDGKK